MNAAPGKGGLKVGVELLFSVDSMQVVKDQRLETPEGDAKPELTRRVGDARDRTR